MDILFFQAVFLGILEGITEFLPVSSTGHIILAIKLFKLSEFQGKIFEVVIQMGAIMAVCWLYRYRLFSLIKGLLNKDERKIVINLFIAFLPIAISGALLYPFIKKYLFSQYIVSFSLIFGGIVMLFTEYKKPVAKYFSLEQISMKAAFITGLSQMFALVPGVSRAAATIIGGIFAGMDRKIATEYSFLLAIPTVLSASLYDIYKNIDVIDNQDIFLVFVGFVSAFFSALLIVKLFLSFISKYGLYVFAYYRIILGTLIFAIVFFK